MPRPTAIRLSCFLLLAIAVSSTLGAAQAPRPLVYWGWLYTVDCLKANLGEFNKAYPDTKVIFKTLSPGEIYLRLPSALSSGIGLPDVVALEDSHLPAMAATGGLLDLTVPAGAYRGKFNAYKWAAVSAGGRIYAMPWDSGPVAVYYRRDIFARAGLPSDPDSVAKLLDTWEDYYRAAKIIKDKTGCYMFPLAGTRNDGRLFEVLLQQQGFNYFDRAGNVILGGPGSVRTLEFLGRMYKEGLTHDSVPWEDHWYAAIRDGSVATVIGAVSLDSFLRWFAGKTSGLWGVVPLPVWTRGTGARTSNGGETLSLAIPKRGRQTEAAWSFVQFMLARKESQVNMMKNHDSFPALEEAYDDPYFSEASPFYGGQAMLKVFTGLARRIPEWRYTEGYFTANSLCSAEIQAYLAGTKDAKTALADAAKNIRGKHR